jgi:hypothetical protein
VGVRVRVPVVCSGCVVAQLAPTRSYGSLPPIARML